MSFLTDSKPSIVSEVQQESNGVIKYLRERFESEVQNDPRRPAWPMNELELSTLYILTRILKPSVVLETGVAHGASSATVLSALSQNQKGALYSIDLPNVEYVTDKGKVTKDAMQGKQTGWLVNENLKDRWTIIPGNTKEELKPILQKLGSVDIFVHDSEHTYENMMFEYETAWPYLRKGGWLVSDDVDWNKAFKEFSLQTRSKARTAENFGLLKKTSD